MDNLESMKTEAATIRERIAKDRERFKLLQERIWTEERRFALRSLVGIENGVTISFGAWRQELRGKKATVLKVNRTRALVAIDGEEWLFPFDLLHVDETSPALERIINSAPRGNA
jgi:hypothetical protein